MKLYHSCWFFNEILAEARMKSANADEIQVFDLDEIKSTHPASSRISSNEVGFHRCRRFHPPARVDLVENDRFLSESVVFCLWATKKLFFAILRMTSNSHIKMKSLLLQGRNQLTLMKSSATPQMKLNPPIRRRGGFHPTKLDFIVEDDFTHPQGWI